MHEHERQAFGSATEEEESRGGGGQQGGDRHARRPQLQHRVQLRISGRLVHEADGGRRWKEVHLGLMI